MPPENKPDSEKGRQRAHSSNNKVKSALDQGSSQDSDTHGDRDDVDIISDNSSDGMKNHPKRKRKTACISSDESSEEDVVTQTIEDGDQLGTTEQKSDEVTPQKTRTEMSKTIRCATTYVDTGFRFDLSEDEWRKCFQDTDDLICKEWRNIVNVKFKENDITDHELKVSNRMSKISGVSDTQRSFTSHFYCSDCNGHMYSLKVLFSSKGASVSIRAPKMKPTPITDDMKSQDGPAFIIQKKEYLNLFLNGCLDSYLWSECIKKHFKRYDDEGHLLVYNGAEATKKRITEGSDVYFGSKGHCTHTGCKKYEVVADIKGNEATIRMLYTGITRHDEQRTSQLRGQVRKSAQKDMIEKKDMTPKKYNDDKLLAMLPDYRQRMSLEEIKPDNVLRTAKSEVLRGQDYHPDPFTDLDIRRTKEMKSKSENAKYLFLIRIVGKPLHMYMFSLNQLDALYLMKARTNVRKLVVYFDATGSLVQSDVNERSRVFLYSAVVKYHQIIMPAFELVSSTHTQDAIQRFLSAYRGFVFNTKANWNVISRIVIDYSVAALNAIMKIFNDMDLMRYLAMCHDYVNNRWTRSEMGKKIIVTLCRNHFIKQVCRNVKNFSASAKLLNLIKESVCCILQSRNYSGVKAAFRNMVLIFQSKYELQNEVLRKALNKVTDAGTFVEEEVPEGFTALEEDSYIDPKSVSSPFHHDLYKIYLEAETDIKKYETDLKKKSKKKKEELVRNPHYCPEFITLFLDHYAAIIPLWTEILVDAKEDFVSSNATVEKYFDSLKGKGFEGKVKVGRFYEDHFRRVHGAALRVIYDIHTAPSRKKKTAQPINLDIELHEDDEVRPKKTKARNPLEDLTTTKKLMDENVKEQFKKRSKNAYSFLKGIRMHKEIKRLTEIPSDKVWEDIEARLFEEQEDDVSAVNSSSNDSSEKEDDSECNDASSDDETEKAHEKTIKGPVKKKKTTCDISDQQKQKLTFDEILKDREDIPEVQDVEKRWKMTGEYVYVYGEDHPVTRKDMFEELLAGPLHHPMVEACIYAIEKKYKFSEGTTICDAFEGLQLFSEDCNVSHDMVEKLKSNVLLIPSLVEKHWFLSVVNYKRKLFHVVGTTETVGMKAMQSLIRYIDQVKKNKTMCITSDHWHLEMPKCLVQEDNVSCGIYMLHYIMQHARGKPYDEKVCVKATRKVLAVLCLQSRSLTPRKARGTQMKKFPNGLFKNIEYYRGMSHFTLCRTYSDGTLTLKGRDMDDLLEYGIVSNSVIDWTLNAVVHNYELNGLFLVLKCSGSYNVLKRRFSASVKEASIDPGEKTIIMPLELDDQMVLVVANVALKTFLCLQCSRDDDLQYLFDNFFKFVEHLQTRNRVKLDEKSSWQIKKYSDTYEAERCRVTNSRAYTLRTSLYILGVKRKEVDKCDDSFRKEIASQLLELSMDMRPRCIFCGNDEYFKPKGTKEYDRMIECNMCMRWAHLKTCVPEFENSMSSHGMLEAEFRCELCVNHAFTLVSRDGVDCQRRTHEARKGVRSHPPYFPIDLEWQREKCKDLKLNLTGKCNQFLNEPRTGGPPGVNYPTINDASCWFRVISLAVTGSEDSHSLIRRKICEFQITITDSLSKYVFPRPLSKVALRESQWATETEIIVSSIMLNTDIYVWSAIENRTDGWIKYSPKMLEGNCETSTDSTDTQMQRAIYVTNPRGLHYKLVVAIISK